MPTNEHVCTWSITGQNEKSYSCRAYLGMFGTVNVINTHNDAYKTCLLQIFFPTPTTIVNVHGMRLRCNNRENIIFFADHSAPQLPIWLQYQLPNWNRESLYYINDCEGFRSALDRCSYNINTALSRHYTAIYNIVNNQLLLPSSIHTRTYT